MYFMQIYKHKLTSHKKNTVSAILPIHPKHTRPCVIIPNHGRATLFIWLTLNTLFFSTSNFTLRLGLEVA